MGREVAEGHIPPEGSGETPPPMWRDPPDVEGSPDVGCGGFGRCGIPPALWSQQCPGCAPRGGLNGVWPRINHIGVPSSERAWVVSGGLKKREGSLAGRPLGETRVALRQRRPGPGERGGISV